jgi:hypothetical protein
MLKLRDIASRLLIVRVCEKRIAFVSIFTNQRRHYPTDDSTGGTT